MRSLVINLTRFGDLLQTQPVISGLKARGEEVGLVCLDNFSGAAGLLRGVDAVFPLPGAALLACLERGWREGLAELWHWAEGGLRPFGAGRIMNLTATLPARLLTRLAGDAPQVGFGMDAFGFGRNSSAWAAFLVASSRNRGSSPFNLVDQFWEVAGLGPGRREYALAGADAGAGSRAGELLAGAPPGCRGLVGFQLGASAAVRRWPLERFAELGALLWRGHGLCPVLLGAPGEAELGARFAALGACPALDLTGRTSLPVLAAVLERMRLLVTNDTGTMHLAAGLGVPVCAVFLATAQPWDTGPYAEGCLCLEPDMACHPCGFHHACTQGHACRRAVRADAVYHYICAWLADGAWGAPGDAGSGVRAWLTRRGAAGVMDLASLSGHETEDRTAWIRLQRHFYRQFLDDGQPAPLAGAPVLSEAFRAEVGPVLEQSAQVLFVLREQVGALARAPVASLKGRVLGNFERLTALWGGNARFAVLGDMWREQSQECASDFKLLEPLVASWQALLGAWSATVQEMA
ncbi:glycosyltransferase family 9 protein [Desulfocurvus sp.]|jgi:ADP-heptose:LPS heptosyltransferase|uniref:glycosyltransferase family 9 protein n=1 Tax=Desulfocurvus sp. TaxID=2871698 RepID=UPI0025BADA50|nr:glycosyltransferase family 9 protein [Desulfocurvus sp.]MCK9240858.1 glycosyltransferase family 9 protein [Desulfocurvus sp.]